MITIKTKQILIILSLISACSVSYVFACESGEVDFSKIHTIAEFRDELARARSCEEKADLSGAWLSYSVIVCSSELKHEEKNSEEIRSIVEQAVEGLERLESTSCDSASSPDASDEHYVIDRETVDTHQGFLQTLYNFVFRHGEKRPNNQKIQKNASDRCSAPALAVVASEMGEVGGSQPLDREFERIDHETADRYHMSLANAERSETIYHGSIDEVVRENAREDAVFGYNALVQNGEKYHPYNEEIQAIVAQAREALERLEFHK